MPCSAYPLGAGAQFAPIPNPHPFGQRLIRISYAADRWFSQGAGFYCYAMGHTHAACLARVVVRSDAAQGVIETFRANHRTDGFSQVHIDTGNGNDGNPLPALWVSGSPASATVRWQGMLGLGKHDWLALDDPDQPNAESRRGLWKWVGDGNTAGEKVFHEPPAGYYVAKGYLDSNDTTKWCQSPEGIGIEGISIEAAKFQGSTNDADFKDTGARKFALSGDSSGGFTFDPPAIVLRWAFYPGPFGQLGNPNDSEEIVWFILLKAGDVGKGDQTDKLKGFRSSNSRPWQDFQKAMPSHSYRGRLPLPEDPFLQFVTAHTPRGGTQQFEIRAFEDTRGNSISNPIRSMQLGMATFTVSRKA